MSSRTDKPLSIKVALPQAERAGVTGGSPKGRDVATRWLGSRQPGLEGHALIALQVFQHPLQCLMLPRG